MDKNMVEDFSTGYIAVTQDVTHLGTENWYQQANWECFQPNFNQFGNLKFQAYSKAIAFGKLLTLIKNTLPLH